MNRKRLLILDEFRGLLVLNMVVFHTIWDLVYMFGNNWQWYIEDRQPWRLWIGANFILLSGFCWKMSKNPLKRGMIVYLSGMLVSMVTILFTPSARIQFGVLTLIGSCVVLMTMFDVLFKKVPPILGILVSAILFFLTFGVNSGYIGFKEWKLVELPSDWYANWFTTYMGLPESGFFSTDYYTIFPWFFMFAAGYFLHLLILDGKNGQPTKESGVVKILKKSICPPLGWVGRHALIIYMIHQPVIYGVLTAWYMIK